MPGPADDDDWITVPRAAELLGMALHSVYDLIDRGELQGEVARSSIRPKSRRSFRLRRRDVDDFVDRARVKPGSLRHLYPPTTGRESEKAGE